VPGAFAEFVRIPSARLGRTLYQLPEEVDWLTGALVEPMSVGLRAAGFASVRAGETVLVTGLGPIGLCVVQALSLTGARVVGIDPSARRRVAAIELGAGRVLEPQEDIADDLYDVAPSGFDAVCECSGSDRALVQALEAVRPGGTVVLVGLFGRTLSLAPDPILTKEVRLQGVYAYRTEYARAISLFATGQLRASPLISHRLPLERIADAFAIQANPESGVKVMVVPRADPRDRTRRD
jgi:threonine dehydrogenase-like Zn-dependent dehydrogenase